MIRAFQWDLARQVERLDWLLAQLPRYAEWGYQELHLHLEDAVDYPSLPGVARSDAFSWRQFARLIAAADSAGIRVVPIVNLLGHTQYLIKTPAWRDLNECRDEAGRALPIGQLCPCDPRTWELAKRLIGDVAPFCTAGRVHVGLDESFLIGRHPASRAEIREIGRAGHFARYVNRLHAIASQAGLKTGIWADMLVLLPEAIAELPPGLVAYDWYYHAFKRRPRFELYNFAEYDLAPALRRRGIDYWGCPMDGAFRYEPMPVFGERLANATAWWRRCHQVKAQGMLVTGWEPNRLAIELTTVVDAAIAGLWLTPGTDDHATLLAGGFERALGLAPTRAREAARLALAGDDRAHVGYARWEINSRWNGFAGCGASRRLAEEESFFRRAATADWPEPFHASLRWRHYLAQRDLFVRTAAQGVHRCRRLHRRGSQAELARLLRTLTKQADAFGNSLANAKLAAQTMWRRTRRAAQANPNETILQDDRRQWTSWKRWLRRAAQDGSSVVRDAPVAARWQMVLTIHNCRPGLHQVVLQSRETDGQWQDLGARHTIEFRTAAARPRSPIKRQWSVAVPDPATLFRLAVRGVGEVAVSQVFLTDGVSRLKNRTWPTGQRKRLGRKALRAGWPELDWSRNLAELDLRF